jgi:hypothetical protein
MFSIPPKNNLNIETNYFTCCFVWCEGVENRALRGIREPKWEKAAGGWRKICDDEVFILFLPDIFRITQINEDKGDGASRS